MNLASKVLNKSMGAHVPILPFIDINKYAFLEEEIQQDEELIYIQKGDFVEINAGRIALNFYCKNCEDSRTFMSSDKLHCLIINENLISIDAFLQCPVCETTIQVWYLVEVKDMFSEEPKAKILKRTEKLSNSVSELNTNAFGNYTELLEKATRASREGFGAGSIIYLRKVFESIITRTAEAADPPIETKKPGGNSKPFKQILDSVIEQCDIIPPEFSNNEYKLFGKLSDVVHGEYDEQIALEKFSAFYRLVTGVIENVRNKAELKHAMSSLGLNDGGEEAE